MHNDLEQRRTLSRLLRELPQEAAPPYSYREFRRRARHGVTSVRRVSGGQLLAASLLAAVAVAALTLRLADPGARSQPAAPQNESADALTHGTPAAPTSGNDAMERLLASLPREPAVARVSDRAAVTGLEDRIAQVDDLLSAARSEHMQPARVQMLQQERTRLVGTLVQVRYAETLADASR
jgi:hypothetical protein